MRSFAFPFHGLLLLLLSPLAFVHGDHSLSPRKDPATGDDDPDLFHFVTRPELTPPKWEVKIHNRDRLSDGYWFVGVKPGNVRTLGSGKGYFGPAIYDGEGQLVWSGSAQLDASNMNDFRLQNVAGETRLTMVDSDRKQGLILDSSYQLLHAFLMKEKGDEGMNNHEFQVVDNGSRALIIKHHERLAPREERERIGYTGDKCKGVYDGFQEHDVTRNWESTLDWHSFGKIHLNESAQPPAHAEKNCARKYDFIHANSVDKTPDGDYLFSARHCNTIYRISGEDGSIVWRLGGKQSDFKMEDDVIFSRQHDIRFRGQNQTHTLISLLDNAKGQAEDVKPTWDFSRGLVIALRTDITPMTAELAAHYDHPQGLTDERHAPRRGGLQFLPNGNVFMGWSERALQSEHAADGELLMEAQFRTEWLGSYRNYKFAYEGKPKTKPDVVARAYLGEKDTQKPGESLTEVFVSWNGDTAVDTWKLYGSTSAGNDTLRYLKSKKRNGFETRFEHEDYLSSVRLEGYNKEGKLVGETASVKTTSHPSKPGDFNVPDPPSRDSGASSIPLHIWAIILFMFGFASSVLFVVILGCFDVISLPRIARMRRRFFGTKTSQYTHVPFDEGEEEEEGQRESLIEEYYALEYRDASSQAEKEPS